MVEPPAALAQTRELLGSAAHSPAQLEALIVALTNHIEQMPDVMLSLNETRYETERAYSRRKDTALAMHSKSMPVTAARALAEVEALTEREAADNAKAAWHYADDSMKALTSKLYALLNINRGMRAAYNGYGVGR